MAKLIITGRAAEIGPTYFSVLYDGKPPLYRKVFDVRNLNDCKAAMAEACAAIAGQDVALSAHITDGRKPNGFDAWQSANRSGAFLVRKEAA